MSPQSAIWYAAYGAQFIASLHGQLHAPEHAVDKCEEDARLAANLAVAAFERGQAKRIQAHEHEHGNRTPYGEAKS